MLTEHPLGPGFSVSRQLKPTDVPDVKRLGFTMIVNNRPDREVLPAWAGEAIAEAAEKEGLRYLALPVGGEGFANELIAELAALLRGGEERILAYCASGTRSAMLWGLAAARLGGSPRQLIAAAAAEGYDLGPIADVMAALATRNEGE